MKHVILGLLCSAIAICTIVSCLCIYSVSSRRNEVENCVAQVLKQNLQTYYAKDSSDAEVEAYVRQDLTARLCSASRVSIDIQACDMTLGILSVSVSEEFFMPNGMRRTIQCSKTVIVE